MTNSIISNSKLTPPLNTKKAQLGFTGNLVLWMEIWWKLMGIGWKSFKAIIFPQYYNTSYNSRNVDRWLRETVSIRVSKGGMKMHLRVLNSTALK